jgi:hypothetical protein
VSARQPALVCGGRQDRRFGNPLVARSIPAQTASCPRVAGYAGVRDGHSACIACNRCRPPLSGGRRGGRECDAPVIASQKRRLGK